MEVGGFGGFKICLNLCALKNCIKRQNREEFGRIHESRETFSKIVEDLDKKRESQELTPEEVVSRQKECDRNTSFFHRMATMRGRVNHLGRLRRGGRVLESPIEIKEKVA